MFGFLNMYLRKIVGLDLAHQQYHDSSNRTNWQLVYEDPRTEHTPQ